MWSGGRRETLWIWNNDNNNNNFQFIFIEFSLGISISHDIAPLYALTDCKFENENEAEEEWKMKIRRSNEINPNLNYTIHFMYKRAAHVIIIKSAKWYESIDWRTHSTAQVDFIIPGSHRKSKENDIEPIGKKMPQEWFVSLAREREYEEHMIIFLRNYFIERRLEQKRNENNNNINSSNTIISHKCQTNANCKVINKVNRRRV